jgi:O-antigen ligase
MIERWRVSPRLGWAVVVGAESLLILLLLPFGRVYQGLLWLHEVHLLVLAVVGAAGWVAVIWRPSRLSPFLLLAPLPLFAAVVVTAFVSPYPSLSWPAAWQTAAYAGIFWLLALQASHPAGRRSLVAVIGLVVAVVAASYFAAVLVEWRRLLRLGFPVSSLPLRPSDVGGLAQIPTLLADVVAVGTPVFVATLWRRGARLPAVLFGLVAFGAVVLTGTRSVLLIIAGLALAVVLIAIRDRARRRAVSLVVTAVMALGAVGLVVVLTSARSLDEGRSSAYASALARFVESPILGSGPGTYGVERMHDPVSVLGWLVFPDAHNIVLNNLAESGIVGLVGLVATVALVALAIRGSWRRSPGERLVIAGALFGLAVFAGHGMVDVVFSLIGVTVLAIAVAAVAATSSEPLPASERFRSAPLRAALGVAFVVAVLVSVGLVRTENVYRTVADADAALKSRPADALALARRATASAPDLVPAWWVQMAAAAAINEPAAAMEAARKTAGSEGFGQEWMTVAILAAQQGDRATELDAIGRATAGPPVDPIVELNAIALLDAAGDHAGAQAAAGRLLEIQPDIEPVIGTRSPRVAATIASVRSAVAHNALAAGDERTAFLIALSGEDRGLSQDLLGALTDGGVQGDMRWSTIVDAWFGDPAARKSVESAARSDPSVDGSTWAWRLAGHACDRTAMSFWERATKILFSFRPTGPDKLGIAPLDETRALPQRYPSFIWLQDVPKHPYVPGTLTFSTGRPICTPSAS